MNLTSRYITRQMAVMTAYVLLASFALYNFFEVINEANDLGKSSHNGAKLERHILMQIPARAYELMPLVVLIDGLTSLSQLTSDSELTVIKASGMSTKKPLPILSQSGLIFAITIVTLGKWIAPTLSQEVENIKAAVTNDKISAGSIGFRLREEDSIINVHETLPDHTLLDIKVW